MKNLLSVVCVAMLAACASAPEIPLQGDKEAASLLEKSLASAKSLSPSTASADAKPKEAVMVGGAVSINFAGEAKDLLRRFAAARSLSFAVRGPQPHLPLFVVVDVKSVSLEEFLTDVGAQFGQRADLVLTSTGIEVRYRDQ